ncbi:MAG TPA: hypothetical protein PKM08_02190 [Syntrophorhabdaceae bacterium]|nr:hypothetical protein [Syntrophorhabdaceae bacterium]
MAEEAVSRQLTAFSHQLSAISYQLSANSIKPFIVLAESCELSADRWFLEGATQAPV